MDILRSLPPTDQAKVVRDVIERFPVGDPGSPDTRTEASGTICCAWLPVWRDARSRRRLSPSRRWWRARSKTPRFCSNPRVRSVRWTGRTPMHGYLQSVCEAAGIRYSPGASMAALFKLVRRGHPRLADLGPRGDDIERVLNSCAQILDAMNPVRNQASVAHPNPRLLGEAEARLVLNVAHTLLGYLDAKLRWHVDHRLRRVPLQVRGRRPSRRLLPPQGRHDDLPAGRDRRLRRAAGQAGTAHHRRRLPVSQGPGGRGSRPPRGDRRRVVSIAHLGHLRAPGAGVGGRPTRVAGVALSSENHRPVLDR